MDKKICRWKTYFRRIQRRIFKNNRYLLFKNSLFKQKAICNKF